MIWYRVHTDSCDVVEVALRDHHGLLSCESVVRFLQGMDFKGLSGGIDVVVYEALRMHAGADGAAAVHEAALHDKVIDEKTWNEKWCEDYGPDGTRSITGYCGFGLTLLWMQTT